MSQKSTKKLIYIPKRRINREARKIAKIFDVAGRVHSIAKQECYITLKDHKEDYRTNAKYRSHSKNKEMKQRRFNETKFWVFFVFLRKSS